MDLHVRKYYRNKKTKQNKKKKTSKEKKKPTNKQKKKTKRNKNKNNFSLQKMLAQSYHPLSLATLRRLFAGLLTHEASLPRGKKYSFFLFFVYSLFCVFFFQTCTYPNFTIRQLAFHHVFILYIYYIIELGEN